MLTIGVIGVADASPPEEEAAEAVGQYIAEGSNTLICGGRGGVMAAACRGAIRAGGLTVGILPGNTTADANPWVAVPIPTGLGEARNAIITRAADALIAIGTGWGTLSEIALAVKMNKPVVALGSAPFLRDFAGGAVIWTDDPVEAVEWALDRAARQADQS
jgi:uncharacterized protein (TIGR00725 family)